MIDGRSERSLKSAARAINIPISPSVDDEVQTGHERAREISSAPDGPCPVAVGTGARFPVHRVQARHDRSCRIRPRDEGCPGGAKVRGQTTRSGGCSRRREQRGRDVRDAGEQAWFRETFCNGAQACVQGWDWAVATSDQKLGSGTGFAMVGREGTVNGRFATSSWECVCGGPFCIGGTQCYWVEFWHGLIVPGHWVSIDVTGGGHYVRWSLDGAGPNTQVSLRGPLLMGTPRCRTPTGNREHLFRPPLTGGQTQAS